MTWMIVTRIIISCETFLNFIERNFEELNGAEGRMLIFSTNVDNKQRID